MGGLADPRGGPGWAYGSAARGQEAEVGAGYDVVLVLHVTIAVVALGAMMATAAYAALGASSRGWGNASVRRFFGPGTNWASRSLLLVPLPGFALVGLSRGGIGFGQAWLVAGTVLWGTSAGVALAVVWPAERKLQRDLGASARGDPRDEHRSVSARVAAGAGAVSVLLVAALVVMMVQPGIQG